MPSTDNTNVGMRVAVAVGSAVDVTPLGVDDAVGSAAAVGGSGVDVLAAVGRVVAVAAAVLATEAVVGVFAGRTVDVADGAGALVGVSAGSSEEQAVAVTINRVNATKMTRLREGIKLLLAFGTQSHRADERRDRSHERPLARVAVPLIVARVRRELQGPLHHQHDVQAPRDIWLVSTNPNRWFVRGFVARTT